MAVQPQGDGVTLLYASIVLLCFCYVTYGTRVATRLWRHSLGMDDHLMGLGLMLFTVTASLCIVCAFYGSGQKAAILPAYAKMTGTKLFFVAEFFYASGAVAIKCSIAVTLLRIADSRRRFVWTIWAIMGASLISCIVFCAGVGNICHPIERLWGATTEGSCDQRLNSNVSFFFSAIEILTDWALAILPGVLLWNVQMKAKIKFFVVSMLGLGAFASCATIIRLRYLSLYSDSAEFMYSTGKIGLWSVIEEGIGIFAGSLPALRPLLNLAFLGGGDSSENSEDPASRKGGNGRSNFNKPRTGRYNGPRQGHGRDVDLDTFVQLDDAAGSEGDGESQKHILKSTEVTQTTTTLPDDKTDAGSWERSQVLGWKKSQF